MEPPQWSNNIVGFCYSILEQLEIQHWELSILLCSDPVIRRLNQRYRGIDTPTDVLSFPLADGQISPDGRCYAGDVVISLDSAAKNANHPHPDLREEVQRLLVHGILHLQGYDHHNKNSPMIAIQERLLMSAKCQL